MTPIPMESPWSWEVRRGSRGGRGSSARVPGVGEGGAVESPGILAQGCSECRLSSSEAGLGGGTGPACLHRRGGGNLCSDRSCHAGHTPASPADHLRGPLPTEEDLQSAQRDAQQRRPVLGLSASIGSFPSLFLASLKLPFLEMGTSGGWLTSGPHGAFQGSRGCRGASAAQAPTYRCTSDRPSGGHTSGGSHTWGRCLCPHSCAGSLRFHSYRSLVRPGAETCV